MNENPMDIKTAAGIAERVFQTHRVGDLDGTLRTVRVTAPETAALVLDLVEGRAKREPNRERYRWAGHGMNTREIESLRFGTFCPACGVVRMQCKCEERMTRLADAFGNGGGGKRRATQGWQDPAASAASRIPRDAFEVAP